MFHFEWLWALLLLPLPLLVRFAAKPVPSHSRAALRVSFIRDFGVPAQKHRAGLHVSHPWMIAMAALAWVLLVLAAARPQWVDQITHVQTSGRDLMLAMDVSGSMRTEDFTLANRRVARLDAARAVASDFIRRREGDRLGLIVFGEKPYLQMPLSFDLQTVQEMLNATFIGLAGERTTAIGDAIGLAIKRLREYKESNRVLILLTDGANNAGTLDPVAAAKVAAHEGMKIYTIGIGAHARGGFFIQRAPELDEATLRMVAHETGGRYFRATNTGELQQIYALLDKLELIEREQKTVRLQTELYPWPLAMAGLIALCLLFIHGLQRRPAWI